MDTTISECISDQEKQNQASTGKPIQEYWAWSPFHPEIRAIITLHPDGAKMRFVRVARISKSQQLLEIAKWIHWRIQRRLSSLALIVGNYF